MTDLRTPLQPAPASPGTGAVLDAAPAASAPEDPRARRLAWARRPLAVYGASRLLVLVVAATVSRWSDARGIDPGAGPWPWRPGSLPASLTALGRWDSAWYANIAAGGYPGAGALPEGQRDLAFFPLFPMLTRAVAALTPLSATAAGVVVSLAAGGAAVLLIWQLMAELSGSEAADRASAVFSFFPGAVVLSMAYSEGLLVAGAAGTMLALRRRRWLLAGVVAGVSTLSRPNALAVVAMCALASLGALLERRDWRSLLAPALAPVGLLGFFGFLAARTGWPLAWFRAQRDGWRDSMALDGAPAEHLRAMWAGELFSLQSTELNPLVGILGLVFVAFSGVLLVRWKPPAALIAYALVCVVLALASQRVGARPRMIMAAFPLLLAVGVRYTGRAHAAIVGASAVASCGAAVLFFSSHAITP